MSPNLKLSLLGAIVCSAALALLAYAAYSVGPIGHLDLRVYLHFQFAGYPGLFPAQVLVHLGDLIPLVIFIAAIVATGNRFGRHRETVAALAVVVGANVSTQLLKIALEHPRHDQGGHVAWTQLLPSENAFPSGHTTAAASVAIAMLFVVPARHRMAAAAGGSILTAAVATSVVVLGWHYPSDAVGAVLVSAIWGFLILATLRRESDSHHRSTVTAPKRGAMREADRAWARTG